MRWNLSAVIWGDRAELMKARYTLDCEVDTILRSLRERRMKRLIWAIVAALVLACVAPHAAAAYPEKAITLIVPFPPGGRTDLTARVVAQYLPKHIRQSVVVV